MTSADSLTVHTALEWDDRDRAARARDEASEIARQLGVMNILEGSVQKAGDKVRVNVQFIDARADSHLWAKTYDRDLADLYVRAATLPQASPATGSSRGTP